MDLVHLKSLCRWILGGVLGLAGILKLVDPQNLAEVIEFFFTIDFEIALWLVYGISLAELLLAALLISQHLKAISYKLVLGLCFIFLAIAVMGSLNDWEQSCGCLGRFSFGQFDGKMIIRNAAMLVMAVVLNIHTEKRKPEKGSNMNK